MLLWYIVLSRRGRCLCLSNMVEPCAPAVARLRFHSSPSTTSQVMVRPTEEQSLGPVGIRCIVGW